MLETHQGLAWFSEAMGALGAVSTLGLGGWVYSLGLQKQRIEEKISELISDAQKHAAENKEYFTAQFKRIDELRDSQMKFVTIERHDISRREIFEAIEKAMQPLTEAINRLLTDNRELRDQINRILERGSK